MKITDELKKELLNGFEKYLDSQTELSEDNINIIKLIPSLLELQNQKSLVYGRSYCKHSHLSIFLNVERKWDRISNIMENVMKNGLDSLFNGTSGTPTETFMDTVVDLGLYSLMWAGYISEEHPELQEQFLSLNELHKFM